MRKLTVSDVRSTVQAAIITTGCGDGSNDRQELDYDWLTRALNDMFEEEQEIETPEMSTGDWLQHHHHFNPSPDCHLCRKP
jgi:hypothetical protein